MYRINHCVAGCMTRYLPREKIISRGSRGSTDIDRVGNIVSMVPRAKVLPRLPREIIFPR